MDSSTASDVDSSEIEELEIVALRREYVFHDRIFITDPSMFRERFRFTHRLFEVLLQRLGPFLAPATRRSHAISATDKLLIGLRYYASNQEYYNAGDTQGFVF